MDKYEYKLKTEQMLELMDKGAYNKAAEVADTIDWKRVRNATMLTTVSDIYEKNEDFQKSYEVLNVAYHRAEGSRKVIYRLCALALKTGNVDEAIDYYDDFKEVAPKDPNQHILRYKILRARRAPADQQIEALEEFKKAEYIEEWAFELARLYQEAGMTAECLEECDDLILWFSEGKFVYAAMELKMQYKPLTPSQQEKYDKRYERLEKPKAEPDESHTEEIPNIVEYRAKKEGAETGSEGNAEQILGKVILAQEAELADEVPYEDDEVMQKLEQKGIGSRMKLGDALKSLLNSDSAQEMEQSVQDDAIPELEAAIEEIESVMDLGLSDKLDAEKAFDQDLEELKVEPLPEEVEKELTVEPDVEKAVEENIEIEKAVKPVKEDQVQGQLSIEDILTGWDNEESETEESVEQKREKPEEPILPPDIQRMIDEIEGVIPAKEIETPEEEIETPEESVQLPQREEDLEEIQDLDEIEEEIEEIDELEEEFEEEEYEEDLLEEDLEEEEFEEDIEEIDELEEDFEEEEYEEDLLEEDLEEEEFEEEIEEIDELEEEFEEEEYEEESLEEDLEEEEFEEDIEEIDELEVDFEEEEYEEDSLEEDLEEEEFEEDIEEIDEPEEDFDEYEEELEDSDEQDYAASIEDIAANFEKEFGLNQDVEAEFDDREVFDEKDKEIDILSATTPLSRKQTAKMIATGKTAPLPVDEISNALSLSNTGFVVHGRYDLEMQSGIGTRAGLTDEQKQLFSYFVPVRGMSEQLVDVLEQDRNCTNRNGTSATGNLLIIGNKGNGKTVLAVDVVKAIQKQRNIRQGKVAIVTGDSLNKKRVGDIFSKLRGGALIIEKAGRLNEKTVARLNKEMEHDTGELLVVLEEQRKPLDRILSSNREFRRKFTSRLEVPIFINDELVTFGQTYAQENGYRIDEMGILALYSRIDALQREDHAVTVSEVKEVMDEAMDHSQKASAKKLVRRVFGKNTDDSDRILLSEKDFNF